MPQLRESAAELKNAVEDLNYVLENPENTPSTSRKRSATPLQHTSKRKRHTSGVLTLEEIKNSLNFNPSPTASLPSLQECKSAEEKVKLLYSWEISAVRLQTRACFHQGFYLQQLIKEHSYTTKDLHSTFPDIPEYNIKRNLQLYNSLGDYRTILYSTLSVSRLWKSISAIKQELDKLSVEDREYWITPPTNNQASCFIKCYKEWFDKDPSKNIYFVLDIYDNDFSHYTQNTLIEQLSFVVLKVEKPEVDQLNLEDIPLYYNKYMLWYYIENMPAAQLCYNNKTK